MRMDEDDSDEASEDCRESEESENESDLEGGMSSSECNSDDAESEL